MSAPEAKSQRVVQILLTTQNCCGQQYKFDQDVSDGGKERAAAFPHCLQDDGSAVDLAEGQDRVSAASAALEVGLFHQKRISERIQIVDVPVPHSAQPVDQPGDQACRVSADSIHRHACCDAANGPSNSDWVEDSGNPDHPGDQACRVPTDSIHRQSCCRDACGDAAKGPSESDCVEDSGNPVGRVVEGPVIMQMRQCRLSRSRSVSARIHEQTVDQPGDPACRDPTRQSYGCAVTVMGGDSREERYCGSVRSSIFDGLMAKLHGNAEQEDPQVEEESSSWTGDLAGTSWRQGKSARNWARYRGWRKEGHDSWSWAETDGLGAGSCLSGRQTTVSIVHTDFPSSRSGTCSLADSRLNFDFVLSS